MLLSVIVCTPLRQTALVFIPACLWFMNLSLSLSLSALSLDLLSASNELPNFIKFHQQHACAAWT